MKTYELTYIISPEITSEEAEAKAKQIGSLITSKEGVIVKQSNPTAKAMSYPVKKRASGFMGVLEFQLEPEKLLELKDTLNKDQIINRHMIVAMPPVKIKKARRIRPVAAPIEEIKPATISPKVSLGAEKV